MVAVKTVSLGTIMPGDVVKCPVRSLEPEFKRYILVVEVQHHPPGDVLAEVVIIGVSGYSFTGKPDDYVFIPVKGNEG